MNNPKPRNLTASRLWAIAVLVSIVGCFMANVTLHDVQEALISLPIYVRSAIVATFITMTILCAYDAIKEIKGDLKSNRILLEKEVKENE